MSGAKSLTRRLLAGVAAAATLLSGLAFAGTASADTYTTDDQFVAGDFDNKHAVNLTVKKYLSNQDASSDYTGSSQDEKLITDNNKDAKPAANVVFSLTKVIAHKKGDKIKQADGTDLTLPGVKIPDKNDDGTVKKDASGNTIYTYRDYEPADFYNDNHNNAWQKDSTATVYYGITGTDGVIKQWYSSYTAPAEGKDPSASNLSTEASLPKEHQYYVLEEIARPAKYADYQMSQQSVFDLPYYTSNVTAANPKGVAGYVYDLHVYPKNVSNNPVSKRVVDINGDVNAPAIKAGDDVDYEVAYRFAGVTAPSPETEASKKQMYISNIEGAYQDVRIVDRMSSALRYQSATAEVQYTVDGVAQNPIKLTAGTDGDYQETTPTAEPKTLTDSSKNMFTNHVDATGTTYHQFDFFGNKDGANYKAIKAIPSNATNVRIVISIKAEATGDGDGEGHDEAKLFNDAASSDKKGNNWETDTYTASAGFQFAKTTKDGTKALQGAKFMLRKPSTTDQYFASDGEFYTKAQLDEKNATITDANKKLSFISAESNAKGIVTFVNLPLFDMTKTTDASTQTITYAYKFKDADHLSFDMVETTMPVYGKDKDGNNITYQAPRVTFPVTFAKRANQPIDANTNAESFQPDRVDLTEGYTATLVPSESIDWKNINGTQLTKGLINFAPGQDQPIHLPLTGGQGIILLLVLGAAIMAVVIIERKRRASKARR